jgi:hypothetical protein
MTTVNTDDGSIAETIRAELVEGLQSVDRAGFTGGTVKSSQLPNTAGVLFEIGGSFERCPNRRVYATVEI